MFLLLHNSLEARRVSIDRFILQYKIDERAAESDSLAPMMIQTSGALIEISTSDVAPQIGDESSHGKQLNSPRP